MHAEMKRKKNTAHKCTAISRRQNNPSVFVRLLHLFPTNRTSWARSLRGGKVNTGGEPRAECSIQRQTQYRNVPCVALYLLSVEGVVGAVRDTAPAADKLAAAVMYTSCRYPFLRAPSTTMEIDKRYYTSEWLAG
ncbi:hypothetical protein E2C01_037658 [Portunus trituberculatus]|uniref:Uncharacterized protein n=1 Tax=Portunus trituberculatus TaxID=210409 RepID=A0A5B7FFJ2_PORTR|nr:hypothetical protein [Portunus trituberculatus]